MNTEERKPKTVTDRGVASAGASVLPSPNARETHKTMHKMPVVHFESDLDSTRFMFCAEPDAPQCKVRVWYGNTMDEPEGAPAATFVGYWPHGPDEYCWVVDWGATRIEFERPDGTVHALWPAN